MVPVNGVVMSARACQANKKAAEATSATKRYFFVLGFMAWHPGYERRACLLLILLDRMYLTVSHHQWLRFLQRLGPLQKDIQHY